MLPKLHWKSKVVKQNVDIIYETFLKTFTSDFKKIKNQVRENYL